MSSTTTPGGSAAQWPDLPARMRVHELAKRAGSSSKEILALLAERGQPVSSAASSVDAATAAAVLTDLLGPPEPVPAEQLADRPPGVADAEVAFEAGSADAAVADPDDAVAAVETTDLLVEAIAATDSPEVDSPVFVEPEDGESAGRRRRRRGRRGRGKAVGETEAGTDAPADADGPAAGADATEDPESGPAGEPADAVADAAESAPTDGERAEDDDSDTESGGAGTRRRRRRRRQPVATNRPARTIRTTPSSTSANRAARPRAEVAGRPGLHPTGGQAAAPPRLPGHPPPAADPDRGRVPGPPRGGATG